MPTYCFFDQQKVTDSKKMDRYWKKVLATVTHYGGRYIIIGGPFEIIEGIWGPNFPVVIEFSTREKAYEWYDSQEYMHLKSLRMEAAVTNVVFIQGL